MTNWTMYSIVEVGPTGRTPPSGKNRRDSLWFFGGNRLFGFFGTFRLMRRRLDRHTEADVLPDEGELLCHVLQRRVVSRVVEGAQPLCGLLAQRRVRCEECIDQFLSACREFSQFTLHLLQESQRAKVDPGLK